MSVIMKAIMSTSMHIYSRNGAVPVILSCTGHMFLVFELSTREYVEMARVFLPRTDHMILQNILIVRVKLGG